MDQAEMLRKLIKTKGNKKFPFKVITVSSGKGGVGKTNFTSNLAVALSKKGMRVAILDADFGMADVDIIFGIKSKYNIYDMLYKGKSMEDITITTTEGIRIIPGGSGILELSEIEDSKIEKLMQEFSKINNIDILLIDTGAGVSKNILNFIELSDEAVIVTNTEPTSLTDAYGLIKVLVNNKLNSSINIIINRVKNIKEAKETFEKLSRTIEVFLETKVNYLGFITEDSKVGQAVKEQQPFVSAYPKTDASLCMFSISSKILGENDKPKNSSINDYLSKLLKIMRR